ncbi:MAG TPA: class I SAM-dependent methyltransferase [Micromonosporaceae bacterium]
MAQRSAEASKLLASPISPDEATAVGAMQARVDELLGGREGLRVLEAGCGPRLNLKFPPGTYVIGVDEDEVALARNEELSEAIVADLGGYQVEPASLDAVVCWYVLEHVDRPAEIITGFARAVKPGGIIALAVPNLHSPKSVITKFTPHMFHVWFRRHILGRKLAGTPGHGPYPTTLRRAIAPGSMTRLAERLGLDVVHVGWYEDGKQIQAREKAHVTGAAWSAVRGAVKVGSLGVLDAARSEFLVILRRRPDAAVPAVRQQAAEVPSLAE